MIHIPSQLSQQAVRDYWSEKWQPLLRKLYLDKKVMEAPYAKWIYALLDGFFRLGCIPFLIDRFPWMDPKQNNLTCIPINPDIKGSEGSGMPYHVLDHFIETARYRVIVEVCPCRKILGCKRYPIDVGCMMMGESAVHIPKKISREVGVNEAKSHVRRAIKAGLIPTTGRARIDKDFFMVPEGDKLLTLCFCCECCSATRLFRYAPPEKLDRMHVPVEGLSIGVTQACDGCGQCTQACHVGAIEVRRGRASIGKMCRLCGRCALQCPRKAIELWLDNPKAAEDVIRRIESVVDY